MTNPPGREVQRSVDPATGEERATVRFVREDGAIVESETIAGKDRVRSSVSVTAAGVKDEWVFEDDLRDDGNDRVFHRVGDAVEGGFSPADFLAKRAELFTDRSRGVEPGKIPGTYAVEYTSAVLLSTGTSPEGETVHALASLGVHAAFPFPGEHWDEGQLAILDASYRPTLTLRMPKEDDATHLDISFSDEGTSEKRVVYAGYMMDDAGKLRFVQAEYRLREHEVKKKDPALWDRVVGAVTGGINDIIGFTEHAKVLEDLGAPASRLSIDGREVMKVEGTLSAIDDGARFNSLPNTRLLQINYAPEDAPFLALVDPQEKQVRTRFDATLLVDEHALLHRLIPSFLRRGTLAAHFVADRDGTRRDVDEALVVDGAPLSSKTYTWTFDGTPIATITRDLVRVRDAKGNIELGFRETIRKID